jgi:hypothetical protein
VLFSPPIEQSELRDRVSLPEIDWQSSDQVFERNARATKTGHSVHDISIDDDYGSCHPFPVISAFAQRKPRWKKMAGNGKYFLNA